MIGTSSGLPRCCRTQPRLEAGWVPSRLGSIHHDADGRVNGDVVMLLCNFPLFACGGSIFLFAIVHARSR